MERKFSPLAIALASTALPACLSVGLACCRDLVTVAGANPPRVSGMTSSAPGFAAATPTPVPPAAVHAEAGNVRFSVQPDRSAVLGGGDGIVSVEVAIRANVDPACCRAVRQPTDLVVILDTSGSMTGQKVRDAQAAAHELLGLLDEQDRFGLVDFDTTARVVVPLSPVTASSRHLWNQWIDGLRADGSTSTQAGLDHGLGLFERGSGRIGRAILISDGLPNTQDGLEDRARNAARAEIPLTTVGIGADYDEALMSRLADLGTGNFYWVQQKDDLSRVFANEFATARETVLTGLQVIWHPGDGARLVNAAGYALEPTGSGTSFRVGSLYAAQERRFWVTLQVPATGSAPRDLGSFELVLTHPDGETSHLSAPLGSVEVASDTSSWVASIDATTWSRSVVEEEYNVLRAEVGRLVQAGQRDDALSAISDYRSRTAAVNAAVRSPVVTANLVDADRLTQEVESQFVGADQDARQNQWAKSMNSQAWTERRQGQVRK